MRSEAAFRRLLAQVSGVTRTEPENLAADFIDVIRQVSSRRELGGSSAARAGIRQGRARARGGDPETADALADFDLENPGNPRHESRCSAGGSLGTRRTEAASTMDPVLSVRELAEVLRLSDRTVYRLAQSGEIPGFKVGGSWRFSRTDVEDWMARQVSDTKKQAKKSQGTSRSRRRSGPRK